MPKVDWEREEYREDGLNDLLRQYRAVRDNPEAEMPVPYGEEILIGLRELYKTRWHIFNDKHTALEIAFEEQKAAASRAREAEARKLAAPSQPSAPSEWDGKGPCPSCKREPVDGSTMEAVERGMKWLEDHNG